MTDTPLVYIIVLNYNRREDTLACLESVLKTDYPNCRVMLVDNASADGTADAVRASFPGVEVVETGANLMYAGGNNAGMKAALEAGADYVLLLNNDTVVAPDMLSVMMAAMKAYPEAGVAGPMIYYYPPRPDGELIWYAGGVVELWQGLVAHRGIRQKDTGRFSGIEPTGYVTGCGMLISAECIDRAGMLDTGYTMYAEDADLSLRAAEAGFELLFVPKAMMWHKVSVSAGGEFSAFKLRHKLRSNLRLFKRHASVWHWFTAPPLFLLRTLVSIIFRLGPL